MNKNETVQQPLAPATCSATCNECGGNHEPSGARSDCIQHWKLRALQAENIILVQKVYGADFRHELCRWLDGQDIHGENIGHIRRQCFLPWDSKWNSIVRDETAAREKSPNNAISESHEI